MTDDQTVEQMGALKRVRSLIGRSGTTFTHNFATFPLCCPSRATYLTGQYAHNHGVRNNWGQEGGFYKLDSSNTLPVWLRDAGYATAHVGKYLNDYGTRDPREVPAGWEEWYGSVDPTSYDYFSYCLNENGQLATYDMQPGLVTACPDASPKPGAYQSDLYTHKAVDFINRRAPAHRPALLPLGGLPGPAHRQGRRALPRPGPAGATPPVALHTGPTAPAARVQRAQRARQAGSDPRAEPLRQ